MKEGSEDYQIQNEAWFNPPNLQVQKSKPEKTWPTSSCEYDLFGQKCRGIKRILQNVITNASGNKTKDQSHSSHWFLYKKCCVNETLAKRVVTAIQHQKPTIFLDKAISKFGEGNFSNEAMRYCLLNEKTKKTCKYIKRYAPFDDYCILNLNLLFSVSPFSV